MNMIGGRFLQRYKYALASLSKYQKQRLNPSIWTTFSNLANILAFIPFLRLIILNLIT